MLEHSARILNSIDLSARMLKRTTYDIQMPMNEKIDRTQPNHNLQSREQLVKTFEGHGTNKTNKFRSLLEIQGRVFGGSMQLAVIS